MSEMRIRTSSWVVSALWLAFGVIAAVKLPQFEKVFEDLGGPATSALSTRVVMALGPIGWAAIGVVFATGGVLRDLAAPTRRVPAGLFVIALALTAGFFVVGLFLLLIHIQ